MRPNTRTVRERCSGAFELLRTAVAETGPFERSLLVAHSRRSKYLQDRNDKQI